MASLLSEYESHDTLSFVKSRTPTPGATDGILAPSIDEVDSNPEDLRYLRGKGRYFGVEDPSDPSLDAEPKCNNCSQRGHLKRNCPHVICAYCGVMDDHYTQQCPKAIKCANCGEEGHYRSQCPRQARRIYCTECNSKNHARERCPSIWRSYYLRERTFCRTLHIERVFCYNCGHQGHFGDDCRLRRSSKVPNEDGSAFSGENLPQELKAEYSHKLNEARLQFTQEFTFERRQRFTTPSGEGLPGKREGPTSSRRNSERKKRNNPDFGPRSFQGFSNPTRTISEQHKRNAPGRHPQKPFRPSLQGDRGGRGSSGGAPKSSWGDFEPLRGSRAPNKPSQRSSKPSQRSSKPSQRSSKSSQRSSKPSSPRNAFPFKRRKKGPGG
ncbi:LAQU0S09e01838g1_1 [Lachancea quebecensis]|uniref:LAQU0S09e01838g1_1 n=1 Tax=Lachancea quebecensis TaxID=1654605 RepID=A0A0N7MLV0_9SACH|nr:LAQU0S09e01838g1_1 [Lachancea quebecensis]